MAIWNLREALAEANVNADIEFINVDSNEDAAAQNFLGSPTIQINGEDLEGSDAPSAGFGCRVYNEGGEVRGWPSKEQIRKALLGSDDGGLPVQPQPGCCAY
jgi:hypothetical protein